MWSALGRIGVWVVAPLVIEHVARKSGVTGAVCDAISNFGKVGSRQEQKKPGAIDKLSGKGVSETDGD